ncbi:uncharacterized lipoprotein YehR (DUF1307 family) [Paenibacillus castaneae]|uniref:DUF4349 domain-containing protein n=1 Tax=Paenibacillus castaneae TaxID=474957 RepID=UPI000C9C009D|nr:DUF4349 domain-containing protein [Paenibacillus castaneae]NIK75877.1 uncharacterized lipoprotein YehR (DUF1307 family) [Paenibacillus castaneae]
MNNHTKKRIRLWIVIMIVVGLLGGCSSGNRASSSSPNSSLNDKTSEIATLDSISYEAMTKADSEGNRGAETGTKAGGGFTPELASSVEGFNQKIIYTALLNMQVDELTAAATLLRNAISQSGGYILQFQDIKHDGEIGSSYTIKVPAAGFMSFIDRIEAIEHKRFERNISGKDVSEEYVDLESRLKARQLVEQRLLAMMDKAVKADDLLKFSQQLSEVQEDIESIKGRIRYLDKNVSYSTVELRLYQTDQTLKRVISDNPKLGGRMSDALVGSTKVVWDGLKLLLVILAGALPVLVVLAIIAVPVFWIARLKRRYASERQPTVSDKEEQQPPDL